MISSPSKQVGKKFDSIIKNLGFSSLKKEFNFNFTSPSIKLLQSSDKKLFFEQENYNNNELNQLKGEKNIKQNLESEFENIKPKKESYPIAFTVNDKFLETLINIYSDNDNISTDNNFEKITSNESGNNLNNIEKNYCNSNGLDNNEQISCICLKSNCNNNYCSCHKNNNFCNDNCRCLNCQNKGKKNEDICLKKKEIKNNKVKNICRCKTTKCSSFYCECKKNSLNCSKNCLCVNCENI